MFFIRKKEKETCSSLLGHKVMHDEIFYIIICFLDVYYILEFINFYKKSSFLKTNFPPILAHSKHNLASGCLGLPLSFRPFMGMDRTILLKCSGFCSDSANGIIYGATCPLASSRGLHMAWTISLTLVLCMQVGA